jgi:hypothetical protein
MQVKKHLWITRKKIRAIARAKPRSIITRLTTWFWSLNRRFWVRPARTCWERRK